MCDLFCRSVRLLLLHIWCQFSRFRTSLDELVSQKIHTSGCGLILQTFLCLSWSISLASPSPLAYIVRSHRWRCSVPSTHTHTATTQSNGTKLCSARLVLWCRAIELHNVSKPHEMLMFRQIPSNSLFTIIAADSVGAISELLKFYVADYTMLLPPSLSCHFPPITINMAHTSIFTINLN